MYHYFTIVDNVCTILNERFTLFGAYLKTSIKQEHVCKLFNKREP
jgi:hypothetical protein